MFEIIYQNIKKEDAIEEVIKNVLEKCYQEECIQKSKLIVTVTITDDDNIKQINKKYRNIDKATDVLSFPMFNRDDIKDKIQKNTFEYEDILGDIVVSIPRVKEQAKEYNHSFERELSYMVVHGFYHLMGYDHIKEEDKKEMRPKEEKILNELNILRN